MPCISTLSWLKLSRIRSGSTGATRLWLKLLVLFTCRFWVGRAPKYKRCACHILQLALGANSLLPEDCSCAPEASALMLSHSWHCYIMGPSAIDSYTRLHVYLCALPCMTPVSPSSHISCRQAACAQHSMCPNFMSNTLKNSSHIAGQPAAAA